MQSTHGNPMRLTTLKRPLLQAMDWEKSMLALLILHQIGTMLQQMLRLQKIVKGTRVMMRININILFMHKINPIGYGQVGKKIMLL